jgi:hypothetical protein
MALKIKKSGHYLSKVNGQPIINNQYALDIDSERKKNKQVLGMFKNNGVVETMHDSLQSYMNKMSSKNQSIFDLLKNERNELSKMPNPNPNIVMNISDSPPKSINPINPINVMPINPINVMPMLTNAKKTVMKKKTRKLVNGISSKLFDFTNIEQAPDPNPNPNPNIKYKPKPKPINKSHKRRRRRASHKNRRRL